MKKQKLIVSEPWDFKATDGTNALCGTVVIKLSGRVLIFELDQELSMQGVSGRQLVLSARYEENQFDHEPYTGTVNGGLLASDAVEMETIESLNDRASFVLIGSLKVG